MTAEFFPLRAWWDQSRAVAWGRTMCLYPSRAAQDPAMLPAQWTAQGGPQRLCRVPSMLEQGCQKGPDKHLASLFIYDRGYLYRKVL